MVLLANNVIVIHYSSIPLPVRWSSSYGVVLLPNMNIIVGLCIANST